MWELLIPKQKRKKDFHPSRSHYKSIVQPSQVPAITNTDSDDPFRHRNMVVHELLKTECAYLEDLRVIIGFYLKPLQHDLKLIGSYDCKSTFTRHDANIHMCGGCMFTLTNDFLA